MRTQCMHPHSTCMHNKSKCFVLRLCWGTDTSFGAPCPRLLASAPGLACKMSDAGGLTCRVSDACDVPSARARGESRFGSASCGSSGAGTSSRQRSAKAQASWLLRGARGAPAAVSRQDIAAAAARVTQLSVHAFVMGYSGI